MDAVRTYWQHCKRYMAWAGQHPGADESLGPCVPVWLYGDDIRHSVREKLTAMYMGHVLSKATFSMRSHFPIFVIREAPEAAIVSQYIRLKLSPTYSRYPKPPNSQPK